MIYKTIIILLLSFYHPLHLGVLHIDVSKNQAEVNIRLFTDDLENAILHNNGKTIKMNCKDSIAVYHAKKYISNHFKIKQNKHTIPLKLIDLKKDKDVTEFQYKATIDSKVPLQICCEFFLKLFRDQTNLLIIKQKQAEEGFRMNHNKKCIDVEN